ncbi:MAG TPA: hydrogenase maturation protease [Bryobacteraceae bacterium]|nr:hydrogenase maturation protease [Bryobacteraceae bacterium]
MTPELAPDVAEADLVIFIDASCDNGPGEVASRRVVSERSPSNSSFSHQLTPEVLLAFAERLYGTCPEAILLSVGAASFEFGEGLSEVVQAAIPDLLARVQAASAALHS